MAVTIKSPREIELMREAGKRLEYVHNKMAEIIKPGISTWEIDKYGERLIREQDCIPNFLNYNGFPASICVSVNEEVVHGIPSKDRIIGDGDIVSLDCGLIYKGYHSDAARTHAVGKVDEKVLKLMERTKQSFFEGIKKATDGARRRGLKLKAGMTLAIEPMINLGTAEVEWLDDDWTVVAADGLPSAHYENTILITTGEPEILTLDRW